MNEFERSLEAAPEAVLFVRRDGRITHAGRGAERALGYEHGETRGEALDALMPEASRAEGARQRARFKIGPSRRREGAGLVLCSLREGGRSAPVELRLGPLEARQGAGVLAATGDVAEGEPAESTTARSQALLREAVEVQGVAFAVFGVGGELLAANGAFRDLFMTEDVDPRGAGEAILRALTRGAPGEGDDVASSPARLLWNGRSLRASRRRTRGGELVLTVVDHTEDDAREQGLRCALEAKNEFLSRMSHELRTPLNAVLGFASLLQRDAQAPLNSRQREMVSHIRASGQLLLRLVDEVLDLARIDTGRIDVVSEPVDLAERVRDVVATLNPIASTRGISMEVSSVVASAPTVRADPLRVTQILLNLLSNAIKYGREGGRVVVGARGLEGARVRVTRSC